MSCSLRAFSSPTLQACALPINLAPSWQPPDRHCRELARRVRAQLGAPTKVQASWALLSLDLCGFSSEAWYRDHNLQHHMYTNTPWDNHFRGTDPFLVTDPTVKRNFVQHYIRHSSTRCCCASASTPTTSRTRSSCCAGARTGALASSFCPCTLL